MLRSLENDMDDKEVYDALTALNTALVTASVDIQERCTDLIKVIYKAVGEDGEKCRGLIPHIQAILGLVRSYQLHVDYCMNETQTGLLKAGLLDDHDEMPVDNMMTDLESDEPKRYDLEGADIIKDMIEFFMFEDAMGGDVETAYIHPVELP